MRRLAVHPGLTGVVLVAVFAWRAADDGVALPDPATAASSDARAKRDPDAARRAWLDLGTVELMPGGGEPMTIRLSQGGASC